MGWGAGATAGEAQEGGERRAQVGDDGVECSAVIAGRGAARGEQGDRGRVEGAVSTRDGWGGRGGVGRGERRIAAAGSALAGTPSWACA